LQQLLLKLIVIQFALLIDVQPQLPAPLLTLKELFPPAIEKNWPFGSSVVGELVALIVALAELSDRSGSMEEESTITVFSIVVLTGIEQSTVHAICKFTASPGASELIGNTTLLPE